MVENIGNFAPVAPNRQEPTRTEPTREAEYEGISTTRSGADTVSISREAQELLADEARTETEAATERMEALRSEDNERKETTRRAETERLQAPRENDEPARSAEEQESDRTRA
ncbi:MAG: hypothetical protein IME98_04750 [Proteobacteria bacterium]|nr:hypothetical protein [Pseudomonadota bacterium]